MLEQSREDCDLSSFVGCVSAFGDSRAKDIEINIPLEQCRRSLPEALVLCAGGTLGT
jgi:hypothetical protein